MATFETLYADLRVRRSINHGEMYALLDGIVKTLAIGLPLTAHTLYRARKLVSTWEGNHEEANALFATPAAPGALEV